MLPQGDIAVMNRVVGDELHLLHIRLSIIGKILFIYKDIHYLSHDVISLFRLVYFLLYSTFGEKFKNQGDFF